MPRPAAAPTPTSPLFVRLPASEAEKLDQAAFALKTPKRELVTALIARHVDPTSSEGLRRLRAELGAGPRRVTVETEDERLTLGHASFTPAEPPEVLTAAQLATLLQLDEPTVERLAEEGELPGRRLAGAWRFSREGVLRWLGAARHAAG